MTTVQEAAMRGVSVVHAAPHGIKGVSPTRLKGSAPRNGD